PVPVRVTVGDREDPHRSRVPVVRPRLEELLTMPQPVRHEVREPQSDHTEGGKSGRAVHTTTVGGALARTAQGLRRVGPQNYTGVTPPPASGLAALRAAARRTSRQRASS